MRMGMGNDVDLIGASGVVGTERGFVEAGKRLLKGIGRYHRRNFWVTSPRLRNRLRGTLYGNGPLMLVHRSKWWMIQRRKNLLVLLES
jgi:hypothetical protein